MIKIKVVLCLLILMTSVPVLFSQNRSSPTVTLSGYVRESGSLENIPAVSIYIEGSTWGSVTNEYGFYSMTIPPGQYKILVSYVGYKTITQEVNLTDSQKLNFEMEKSTELLDEIIIEDDPLNNQSRKTQMSVVSMKPSDVEDLPVILGEKDVIKALQLMPGISAGTEGSSGFFVRGGTPDQNLIVLDEAPVYNSSHLFGIFSVFNGDAIKSIDVYKGGFPARFGGRLSSVLKIDTKDGNKERFTGKYNIGLISSSAVLEGPLKKGKTSFLASGRRTYLDLLTLPFQPADLRSTFFFTDFNFKIHHIFNDKNKLYWSNYIGRDKFVSQEDFADNEDYKAGISWGNITSTVRWNHQFGPKLFSNASAIFSNYDFRIFEEDLLEGSKFEFRSTTGINDIGAKFDLNYIPNTRHSIRMGLASTYHNFVPQQVRIRETGIQGSDVKQSLNSLENAIYIEDDWSVHDRFNLSLGFRFSHFQFEDTNYTNPEPRVSFAWRIKEDLALKGSYAQMNQYIHLLSSSQVGLPTDLWVSSTDQVKPQQSQQIAFGMAKDFSEKGYTLSLEGYYKEMTDIITYKEGESFLAFENLEDGREFDWEESITSGQGWAYGAEFLLRKTRGPWTGWLGYTLSWSERQFDEINLGRKFFSKYDRRHDVSLVGIYKPSPKITFSGSWVYTSGFNFTIPNFEAYQGEPSTIRPSSPFSINGRTTPFATERNNFRGESYHRLDLGVQFHKKKKKGRERTWAFSVYNIYNRRNPFFYVITSSDDIEPSQLKKVSLLQIIPSVSYTCKF